MKWLIFMLAVIAGLMVYVRLAPIAVDVWHTTVEGDADQDFDGGVIRIADVSLASLHQEAQGGERTSVLAGAVQEGRSTYVTRSLLWGFPDLTTGEVRENGVAIHARLRFGKSDLGVNGKRVAAWLAAAQ
jgi:hypothetical protein